MTTEPDTVPLPDAHGEPGEGFRSPWSVYQWIDGAPARHGRVADLTAFAADLAGFLTALRQLDPTGPQQRHGLGGARSPRAGARHLKRPAGSGPADARRSLPVTGRLDPPVAVRPDAGRGYHVPMLPTPGGNPRSARAVYPGTFDPFTDGHRDLVNRARHLFAHVTVLVAVNDEKRPTKTGAQRALDIRSALPAHWENVTVAAWNGLTVTYCRQHGAGVIIRGARNAADAASECRLATMNEKLGIETLLLPPRPQLARISSTAVRATGPQPPPTDRVQNTHR